MLCCGVVVVLCFVFYLVVFRTCLCSRISLKKKLCGGVAFVIIKCLVDVVIYLM